MSLHVLYTFLGYGADAWFCLESEKSSWMNGCRWDWMVERLNAFKDGREVGWMDGWMDGDKKVKTEKRGRESIFSVHQEMMDYCKQLLRVFSCCGVCMSHCCGAAHVSHAQTICLFDMFSWCRSESEHMLVSKVKSAHCEQMNPKQTKNTWSTMTNLWRSAYQQG